jgi:hypothetical protein
VYSRGALPNIFSYCPINVAMYFRGPQQRVLGSNHIQDGKSIDRLLFNLNLWSSINALKISPGYLAAINKPSTYIATYPYRPLFSCIQISASALVGEKPSALRTSANSWYQHSPEDQRPYRALMIISVWPSSSPNSGLATVFTIYLVLASR